MRIGLVSIALLMAALIAPAASAQTQSDGLIVRNERIGAIRLGDTLADVVSAFGQPTTAPVFVGQHGILTWSDGPGAGVRVDTWGAQNEVYSISVGRGGEGYATAEGVRVGMSEVDVRIRLGNPDHRIWLEVYQVWSLNYPGLELMLTPDSQVIAITVCLPSNQRRPTANRSWCA
jgi:hypothetical protein